MSFTISLLTKLTRKLKAVYLFLCLLFVSLSSMAGVHSSVPFDPFATDTIFSCGSDSVMLDAGEGFVSYRWSTGEFGHQIAVSHTGTYSVTVKDGGNQIHTDTVFVSLISYTMNGYTTTYTPFVSNPAFSGTAPLWVSFVTTFNYTTVSYYSQATLWNAAEYGFIDSLTFYVEVPNTNPGVPAILSVNMGEGFGMGCIGGTVVTAVTVTDAGYVTVPIKRKVRKGRTYQFTIGRVYTADRSIYGNATALRSSMVPGYDPYCKLIEKGVWMALKGSYITYVAPGKEYYSCFQDSVTLGVVASENYNYLWENGMSAASWTVKPTVNESYPVTISNGIHTCADTAQVEVFTAPFDPFLKDSLYACRSYEQTINAITIPYESYLWHNGSKEPSISVFTDGLISVAATNERGCVARDSMYVVVRSGENKKYKFVGDGLYSDPKNWELVEGETYGKPPTIIGPHETIIINPVGECIMDVEQVVYGCGEFQVINEGKLHVLKHLQLKK